MRFLSFTTRGIAPRERYEAWRGRPWPSLAKLVRTEPPGGEFYAHAQTFDLGKLVLADNRITGQTYDRSASLIRADGFDSINLAITLEGRFHGETPAGSYRGAARTVLIVDMGRPFRQSSTNSRCVNLTFARSTIQRFVPRIDGLHGLVLSGHDAQPLVELVTDLLGRLPGMTDEDGARAGTLLTGAVLSCLGASDVCTLSEEAEQARLGMEIRWIIAQRFREPDLTTDRIAALLGVSRATLYRAFPDEAGISAYLTRLRLERAASALRDPRDARPITQIARAVGFARDSSFSRAFREAFGCTPREWRAIARESPAALVEDDQ
ncbi:AraC family transcriptional regulator [Roseomonas populi]|uniref:AraC family transcriptional regulator n=1 Tax=Roseomonas populi TaxID=3121582 RepID=A0ABT1X1M6_9PROT|nr:AraC family transcriptional regulator [Roseomonas pecuniae]MCR0981988.1 AraC family transcriptional regulator [Roseomonas pecuniae]